MIWWHSTAHFMFRRRQKNSPDERARGSESDALATFDAPPLHLMKILRQMAGWKVGNLCAYFDAHEFSISLSALGGC